MKPSRFAANRAGKKRPVTFMADLDAFNAQIAQLEGKVDEAVRPAAQAGAQVLYEAVLRNVSGIGRVTGTLASSIYQAYSRFDSGPHNAVYFVSWRTSDAALNENGQPIRTGLPTAPHGHLLEYGYIQRYAVNLGKDGHWYTVVKPQNRGKEPPWKARGRRSGTPAEKAAWYQPRKGGPVQIPARPFIAPAAAQLPQAADAAIKKFWEVMGLTK